jgi:CrcB protein
MNAVAIALGGAMGALLRYWVTNGVYLLAGRDFPYGTLAVNVVGSLVMGLLYILLIERVASDGILRGLLLIGLLGSFTTFSTFSIETLNMLEQGEYIKSILNILISVITCIAAAWLGVYTGRQL